MSTYPTAEAAVLAVVRASGGFTADNSARNDWQVLDAPTSLSAVVAMAGDSLEGDNLDGRGDHGYYQEKHLIGINVCVAVGNGATPFAELMALLMASVEHIKDEIRSHDRLNLPAVISRAQPTRTTKPAPVLAQRETTHFMQQIVVTVWCEAVYPTSEGGY